MRALPPPLLALTPGAPAARAGLVRSVGRASEAGLRGVLLREPDLEDGGFLELARELARILAPLGGWLGLHDRLHLVPASGAHAAHVGFRSLAVEPARVVLGDGPTLGASTHAGEPPVDATRVDYRFFGPVFATPSKAGLAEPTGLDGLRAACASGPPVWALGGVEPAHMSAVREAGATGCAVLRGVLGAADPAAATAAYLEAWSAGGAA